MVAQPILRSTNGNKIVSISVKSQGSKDTWGSEYMKGKAPSAEALKCEEHFKELTGGMKTPKWLGYNPNFFWSKLEKVKDQSLKKNYQYIVGAVQQGMKESHPGIDLQQCKLLELFDFILGVDHTIVWNGKVIGFDVTKNPYAPSVKVQKTHQAYRGTKIELLKEFGYQGYIIILWSVKDYENANKEDLKRQLIKGLQSWRPKEFTHIIELK